MQKDHSFIIDNIQVNDRFIQSAFNNSKQQNKTNQVLSETFRMLSLSKLYEANPSDLTTKQMIKGIISSQMLIQNQDEQENTILIDPKQIFPLNKLGNFGRELQRKCMISEKGIMQFEDVKVPKLKEVKTFVNRIQKFGESHNDNKIGWIADHKKYEYRIIVIDKSDGHKGIYFSNSQKAQTVRLILSQRYKYGGNFQNIVGNVNQLLVNKCIEQFKDKLVSRSKLLSKSNRYSRNIQTQNKFEERPSRQQDINTSIFYNDSLNKSRGISNNQPQDNLFNIDGLLQTRVSNAAVLIQKIQQPVNNVGNLMKKALFQTWFEKAMAQKRAVAVRHSYLPVVNNFNYSGNKDERQIDTKSKFDMGNNRTSKKQDSIIQSLNKDKDRESVFRGVQASSIKDRLSQYKQKQSFIKQFNREDDNSQLVFYSIQFITLKSLFFKPIVTIELIRGNKIEQNIILNTIIKKKEPNLYYQLLTNVDDQPLRLKSNLRDYLISLKIIDFLSNQEVISEKITMSAKKVMDKTLIMSDNKLIKIEMGIKTNDLIKNQIKPIDRQATAELNVPPLASIIKQRISTYWQKQSQSQGYYNQVNQSIYKILSEIQAVPLTWWKGLPEDDYSILQIVNTASKILGFKMIRSFPHIIEVFEALYPDLQQMIQKLLSFILTFLKPYYFPEQLNKIQKFHRLIGLQQDCQFISKINLQILTITKLVQFECPLLNDKLIRKNICYGYKMMQYIYQAFSRNFEKTGLVELWNYLYGELELLQLNMVLTAIALIKYYEQDLLKCKRLRQFSQLLESKKVVKISHIIREVTALRQKYFGQTTSLLEQIKNIFNSKPLQPILFQFYHRQTAKIDHRKLNRQLQKKSSLRKVNRQIDIQFPEYPFKKYCLHIYFRKLPEVGGSITLRCNDVDYECLNHQKNKYFIIGEISNTVTLTFLDLKSNQYSCELVFSQGINQFTATLTSTRNSTVYKIVYFGGLLTDTQIQIFKKGKKFDHFISPFIKQVDFLDQMNRPLHETLFLRKYDNNSSKDDLIKKIKVLFCSGSKAFNEIDFYLQQIETIDFTIEQKIDLVKQLATQFSKEFSLSNNSIFYKKFISFFLAKTGFQMSSHQFQCFYDDSLEYEFDAPKMIKCRFIPNHQSNRQFKLDLQALNYLIQKSTKGLYSDIIIQDFIQAIKPSIIQQLGGLYQGDLRLLYSSNGEVNLKCWQIKLRNKNKEMYYEELKEDTADDIEEMEIGDPEVLMTEVLPSFAKITTILDYVNSNKNVDLKTKYQDRDRRKIADSINILKQCQGKFNKVITMRHLNHPKNIHIPFFNYYYELTKDFSTPLVKNIFLNNLKSDLKAVCHFQGALKFGQNAKLESYSYEDQIGLYGNIRRLSRDAKGWFFFGYGKEQHQTVKEQAKVFVNYGYGVFRWQPCQVLGYVNKVKSKGKGRSTKSSKQKKQFLVIFKNQQRFVKQYELQLNSGVHSRLQQIFDKSSRQSKQERSYFDEEGETNGKQPSLKYLSKFMK